MGLGSGIRDPRSGIRDPGSEIRDPRSGIRDPGSGKNPIPDPGSGAGVKKAPDPGSRSATLLTTNLVLWAEVGNQLVGVNGLDELPDSGHHQVQLPHQRAAKCFLLHPDPH
jgi:hypothetical protein